MPDNPVQLTRIQDTRLVGLGGVSVRITHTKEYTDHCLKYNQKNASSNRPVIEYFHNIEEVRFMVDSVILAGPNYFTDCRTVYYLKEILIGSMYQITYQTLRSKDGPYRVAIVKLLCTKP